ncbi:sulfurtransferase [Massilia sp. S19_KUP03_FR1]|uniref:sulfurtransferase n=1 Tax=Massilia sp. S19_KUP03_FR1 TaxID=3025503 RepID=UPI002FCCC0DF
MHTTLISAPDLAAHITDPKWVVVDCRHDLMNLAAGRAAYNAGHLPGARFADMETQLSGEKYAEHGVFRGRHPLPDRTALLATLREWGIDDDSQVVAVDAHGGMYAARLWFLLRWIGHAAVAVLDGGMQTWEALDTTVPTPAPGTITLKAALVDTIEADQVLVHGNIVDARAPDRFRGENETIDPVGGHIPGARNRFFKDNLGPDGRFKDAAQLRAELAPIVGDATASVMQCGSGVTACHNLLALEVAGMPGAKLYPGSWSEWVSDPARPVATGN